MSKQFITFCLIVLAILFIRCEKESETTQVYLSELVYHRNVDQLRLYYYDDQGNLTLRETKFDDRITEKMEYQYENEKVSQIDFYQLDDFANGSLMLEDYYNFEYEDGKLISTTKQSNTRTNTYECSNDRITNVFRNGSNFITYGYDSNNNVQSAERVSDSFGGVTYFLEFEYDNKINPLYKKDPIHEPYDFGLFNEIDLLRYESPNNLLYEISIDDRNDTIYEIEYIYEYNDLDFPTMSYQIFTSKSNGVFRDSINTRYYEYQNL